MKKTLAMFKDVTGVIYEAGLWADSNKELTRLTEFVEVDFPDLPHEVVLSAELSVLTTQEEKVKAAYHDEIEKIEIRRQELMALPAPEEA